MYLHLGVMKHPGRAVRPYCVRFVVFVYWRNVEVAVEPAASSHPSHCQGQYRGWGHRSRADAPILLLRIVQHVLAYFYFLN